MVMGSLVGGCSAIRVADCRRSVAGRSWFSFLPRDVSLCEPDAARGSKNRAISKSKWTDNYVVYIHPDKNTHQIQVFRCYV